MLFFFFFNHTAPTEIYTLSLHDALPISPPLRPIKASRTQPPTKRTGRPPDVSGCRSEEHTSELQSRQYLVCRLLLEKKKNIQSKQTSFHIVSDIIVASEPINGKQQANRS